MAPDEGYSICATSDGHYVISGRIVAVLTDGHLGAGEHARVWDGRNSEGKRVSPGVYMVQMTTSDFSETRKAVVLKLT